MSFLKGGPVSYILIFAVTVFAILFCIIHFIVNLEDPPSWKQQVWLVPTFTFAAFVPLAIVFAIFGLMVWAIVHWSLDQGALTFLNGTMSIQKFVVLLMGFLLLCEIVLHPIFYALSTAVARRKLRKVEKNIISIITDTVVIYIVLDMLPSVEFSGWVSALFLAIMCQIAGWMIEGVILLIGKKKPLAK